MLPQGKANTCAISITCLTSDTKQKPQGISQMCNKQQFWCALDWPMQFQQLNAKRSHSFKVFIFSSCRAQGEKVLAESRKTQTRTVWVSLPLPPQCQTCHALCHICLYDPSSPQEKLLQVLSFYFQIHWWCWDNQGPHKRWLCYSIKVFVLCSSLSISFHDRETSICHLRENLPWKIYYIYHPAQRTQMHTWNKRKSPKKIY